MIEKTLNHLQKLPHHLSSRLSQHLISPKAILDELEIHEGDTIFELGNPVGFFAAAALAAVGEPGRVIIAGPNPDSFDRINHLKSHRQLETVLLSDVLANKAFDDQSADWTILTNLLSSSLHADHFCLALNNYIKPGGSMVLLEWKSQQAAGPQPDRRVTSEQAIKMLGDCGLEFDHALKTPGYHYGIVFTVKS